MKTLLLMRHAKSSWKDADIPDHERPLSKRGKKDAPLIGKLIKEKELVPQKILISSAVRATETASLVRDKSGFKEKKPHKDSKS
jgi:phosphohistidine phosphatase